MFEISIGLDGFPSGARVNKRLAVRGILFSKNELLMVQSNKGEYKFPGGGVEFEEETHDALIREIREETGYVKIRIIELIGETTERKKDRFTENEFFEMRSLYYLCELTSNDLVEQDLDEYENNLGFKPVFISIEKAIINNEKMLPKLSGESKRWTTRDTLVLQELLNTM